MEILGESRNAELTAWTSEITLLDFFRRIAHHVVRFNGFADSLCMDGVAFAVNEAHSVKFRENAENTACTVHVFHVNVVNGRSDFTNARRVTGKSVDVLHGEVCTGFLCNGEQVENRVRATAHGDVETHGVFESGLRGDRTRKDGFIVFIIVAVAEFHNATSCFFKELSTFGVCGDNGTVTRKGKTDRFGKGVHRVGREHTGAATAGRAGGGFDGGGIFIRNARVGGIDHCVDQVERAVGTVLLLHVARFHRTARNEDGRNVQAHGSHEHTRSHLVAVTDADKSVGAVGVGHVFHGVRNQIAGRKAVKHAVMTHCDTVVDGNRVHFFGNATRFADAFCDDFADVTQVNVARDKFGETIANSNDGSSKFFRFCTSRDPQRTCACHFAAFNRLFRTQISHSYTS